MIWSDVEAKTPQAQNSPKSARSQESTSFLVIHQAKMSHQLEPDPVSLQCCEVVVQDLLLPQQEGLSPRGFLGYYQICGSDRFTLFFLCRFALWKSFILWI